MHVPLLPVRLSPSSIERFRECPRRFYWQDVERCDFVAASSPELAVGNAVHRTLELAFRMRPAERDASALERLLDATWKTAWRRDSLGVAGEVAAKADAAQLLARFAASFDLSAQPLKLEQWAKLKLRGQLEIRTRIDRIDEGRVGLRLIDYKTGRRQLDQTDLSRDTAAMIHLLAVTRQAASPVERISHYYLRTGEEVYWEPEPDDLESVAERLAALVQRVVAEREYAPVPGQGCQWCPFALRCPSGPAPLDLESFIGQSDLPEAA